MNRSGYSEDIQDIDEARRCNLWSGAVRSSIRGKRGQKALKDILEALDAMKEKKLIDEELINSSGEFCTLGILGIKRGIDVTEIDPENIEQISDEFDIPCALAREIFFQNDQGPECVDLVENRLVYRAELPENRWLRMRNWVSEHIIDKD